MGLVHLHYRLSGFHWLLLLDWHIVVISVNRAVNYVQELIESMNVIIRWWAPVTFKF